ncbi:Fic/DOC family protein [Chitinimonas koreensis]|uniref:Fic/DOC family protein n=1 Tax=Chitinimonas koreensis TaxID=356302 RepID=UPI0004093EC9|nr:Fic family protein [Chitinimonas koreensis]QNM95767.1 Fic family protein [Chitinimonas koreensis]
MSRYEGSDRYVQPDTGVLINKAGILQQDALDAFEADATAVRLLELIERPITGRFYLDHLRAIHRHIFQDVYDWAGELRTVDIRKGNSHFGNWARIGAYLETELSGIARASFLRGLTPEAFIARLAHYMSEINAAHPFREGNGRAQRAFCAQLAAEAGYFIDFSQVEPNEMIEAMIASFHGNEAPLSVLLTRITAIVEQGE